LGASRLATSVVNTALMLFTPETSVCMASHNNTASTTPPTPAGS